VKLFADAVKVYLTGSY